MKVLVGCCGWAVKGGKKAYFDKFPVVEVQETFYKLPKVETVLSWKRNAPSGFVFCMKAWQAITHPVSSPTWKRAGVNPETLKKMRYGWLRPVKENLEAWEKTVEVAKALDAKIVVVQTPPTMPDSEEIHENVLKFFDHATAFGLLLAWEPRGRIAANRKVVKSICEKTGVLHVVDLMKNNPLTETEILYTRLHGLGKGEVNYSYRYSDEDLRQLAQKLRSISPAESYVLFNNVSMARDAERFIETLKRENQPT
ncbi:MAG: DUF72 domain-containing protein [Candidatus Caldarchaeum sp.]|nr:DUF72 domain-containing protein [Candidatus Caldarchaeum sp.]MCX8201145.1 DUF72 domain-containing protein [Candidatus Caldarchaeum sp.]MDW8434708.1 DUF72 domain-containing protein [Candidatus Caldarchaeum sp.]